MSLRWTENTHLERTSLMSMTLLLLPHPMVVDTGLKRGRWLAANAPTVTIMGRDRSGFAYGEGDTGKTNTTYIRPLSLDLVTSHWPFTNTQRPPPLQNHTGTVTATQIALVLQSQSLLRPRHSPVFGLRVLRTTRIPHRPDGIAMRNDSVPDLHCRCVIERSELG